MNRARLVASSIVLWCAVAHADDHPLVQLALDPCVEASHDEIRRVVAVELGALLSDDRGASADRTRVTATCEGAVVALRVDDPITAKSLSRTIDLGSALPVSRARLVALAIVELVSASWTELEINPRPQVSASGPQPSAEARSAALASVRAQTDRRSPPHLRVSLVGGGTKFFAGTGVLAGGGLQLARDQVGQLGWMIDAQVDHGTEATPLGHVSSDVLSLGAVAVVHRAAGFATLHLGAGMRGGAVKLAGVADTMLTAHGERFWAPWFGPLAVGNVELTFAQRFVLAATLEGGYVVSPVAGLVGGQRVIAVDGAWLGVHASIGMIW